MTDRDDAGRTRGDGTPGRHRSTGAGDERTDALLTAAIRDYGDAGATAELYRRHAPAVLTYARTCCRDPHTAEDLTSEAFARTVQAVRDGKGPVDGWRPYLLAVVRHTAADWADRSRRVDLAPGFGAWLDAAAQRERAGPVNGEEHVVREEEGSTVAEAFRSLPERWRAVLWHAVVEEEPAAEVGVLLGLTSSGVASLTARAREGLKEAYLAVHAGQGTADEECRRYSGRLAAAVRRSRPRQDTHLDRHLERCGRCRRAARELTDLNQRLRTVLPVAVLLFGGPAYLEARAAAAGVTAGASGSGAGGAGQAAVGGAAGSAGVKAVVLAVGAAALLLGGWVLWPGEGDSGGSPGAGAGRAGPSMSSRDVSEPTDSPAPSESVESTARPGLTVTPASGSSAGPSTSATAPLPLAGAPAVGGPSTLRFVSTESCMGIGGGAGARPVEAACGGGASQRWVLLEPYGGDRGRAQVRNEASGMCLTRSGSAEDHAPVDQRVCDAAQENQLWNLWRDDAKGEVALRTTDGSRYLGLVEWPRADKGQEHGTAVGTTRYYYGSDSMRFLYEPALFGE
ncbi:sigma-70 family RNA polymerase sigma factor [Streptomyces sp. NPDC014623]|uniref:sigma-70 family RNA polymerase sigma factor n=1 Tax=Streptomyces sp. NPDC014623 TaxID=3364875 RepID=UPI0036F8338E